MFGWAPRVLVLAALLLCARTAHADDDKSKGDMSRAETEFRKAEDLFAAGQYRDAVERYEKAYELSEIPDILFNIGQCYRNLGDYKSAVDHFERYLEGKPDADNRDAVERTIADLNKKLENKNGATFDNNNGDKDRDTARPFYKHWAFWTGVAVVAVAGGVTGFYLATRPPGSDLGNLDFDK